MDYKDTEDFFAILHGGLDWIERLTNKTPVCRVFIQTVRLKRWAPPHIARSQETQEPFRHSRSVVLHVPPFRTALVVGFWSREGYPEDEALLRAVTPHKEFDESVLADWDESNPRDVAFSKGVGSRVRRGRLRSGAYAARHDWVAQFPAIDRTESCVIEL
jgi:hypothetical protein